MNPSAEIVNKNPTIPVNQGIYEESTTAKGPLGVKITVGECVFRYAKAGAVALVQGKVVCRPALVAAEQGLAVSSTAAGAKVITCTGAAASAAAAAAYENGTLVINAGANKGKRFGIKTNSAIATTASATITLFDELPMNLTATDKIQLVLNRYNGVIVGSEAVDMPVGVAPIAVTAGNYFWLQSGGVASPLHEGNTVACVSVCMGTTGGVKQVYLAGTTGVTATAMVIGKNLDQVGTAGSASAVVLTIESV
jgi:hypothetical protein